MRKYGRRVAELPVTVRAAGNRIVGGIRLDTTDVSEGGAFLRSSFLFEVGELLHLEIPLPSGDVVKTNGKVVRVAKSRGKELVAGMGIEFPELSALDRKALVFELTKTENKTENKTGNNPDSRPNARPDSRASRRVDAKTTGKKS